MRGQLSGCSSSGSVVGVFDGVLVDVFMGILVGVSVGILVRLAFSCDFSEIALFSTVTDNYFS